MRRSHNGPLPSQFSPGREGLEGMEGFGRESLLDVFIVEGYRRL